ncbi:hypothetical protein [Streptomyces sp. NPDC048521]|uniref:hypothetical protein n=1 Tax=Streptomyces sp. NPDC048521 TaxID=3365566 RepID=UPI0037201ABE
MTEVATSPDAFTRHFVNFMAAQDPERLERYRAEAWGLVDDLPQNSPDAMVVTYDRATEK